jgi:hypothetical protein
MDFDVTARNIIMLLVAAAVDDPDVASDCMLHLWYSASIRQQHLDIMRDVVRPLIEDVNKKIASRAPGSMQRKSWILGSITIQVVLEKEQWASLLSRLDLPDGMDAAKARRTRQAVTLATSRKDYRQRHMVTQLPAHRVCCQKYYEDGMLLPFGEALDDFNVPNP